MPTGRTHRNITIFAGMLVIPVVLMVNPAIFASFCAGEIITFWVNPDSDVRKKWGPVGQFLGLQLYEQETAHRSGMTKASRRAKTSPLLMSHMPMIGTVVRWLFLAIPIMALLLVANAVNQTTLAMVFAIYMGMAYSDLWHIWADWITTKFKRGRYEQIVH